MINLICNADAAQTNSDAAEMRKKYTVDDMVALYASYFEIYKLEGENN